MEGDPLWLMIIGSSGVGKSQIMKSVTHPDVQWDKAWSVHDFTESGLRRALASGVVTGKVLVVDDITKILQAEDGTMSVLRVLFGGEFHRWEGGAGGHLNFQDIRSKFNFLVGAVPQVESYRERIQELGERFLIYRYDIEDVDAFLKSLDALTEENERKCSKAMVKYLSKVKMPKKYELSKYADKLRLLAKWIAVARTYIPRRIYAYDGEHVNYMPEPEIGSRLYKQLSKLLTALAYADSRTVPNDSDFDLVMRVAVHCLPLNRLRVINVVLNGVESPAQVKGFLRLEDTPFHEVIMDLELLGVVEVNKDVIWITEEFWELFRGEVEEEQVKQPQEIDWRGRVREMFSQVAGVGRRLTDDTLLEELDEVRQRALEQTIAKPPDEGGMMFEFDLDDKGRPVVRRKKRESGGNSA
jgi:hypothetical protein